MRVVSFCHILCKRKVTVQPAPFGKPHCVLTAAGAAIFLIDWRSAHLHIRRRILMQA